MENSSPIIEKLDIINIRKRAKKISTNDFSTSYTTIPHNLFLNQKFVAKFDFQQLLYTEFPKAKVNDTLQKSLIEAIRFLIMILESLWVLTLLHSGQLELINAVLLVNSLMTFEQYMIRMSSQNALNAYIQGN